MLFSCNVCITASSDVAFYYKERSRETITTSVSRTLQTGSSVESFRRFSALGTVVSIGILPTGYFKLTGIRRKDGGVSSVVRGYCFATVTGG